MAITFLQSILKRISDRSTANDPPDCPSIQCFESAQIQADAFEGRPRGVRTVLLDRIVGSVGRYQDFDSRFRFRQSAPTERYLKIRKAMRQGAVMPPVKLFQIKESYYVLDGNHRIAAAKELGHDEICGQIVEFIPGEGSLENVIYRERADFADRAGLSQEITLTEVGQYRWLHKQIEQHLSHLQKDDAQISFEQAARDWWQTIYRPLCLMIERNHLLARFPDRTIADLFVYITTNRWFRGRERQYGESLDRLIPNSMEAFREKMKAIERKDYPEMKRSITFFILIQVQGKREDRIIEKLYEMAPVCEIHSVHGGVDLLVKVAMTRDLLSSDAEMISQFVHQNVRQLAGVISTQTLIPGHSRIKPVPGP